MNVFRRFLRKLARYVVTAYANIIYRQAVKNADIRYKQEQKMIYVVEDMFHPGRLTTYDRARFKREKQIIGTPARLMTCNTLKMRSFYHTPDTAGNQAMTRREKETARLAFVRDRLKAAKLV